MIDAITAQLRQQSLYDLLPSQFRQADIEQGFPLLALMTAFQRVNDGLQTGIASLEADWFIETCPLDLVSNIGALVGLSMPTPVRPEHRSLVADMLGLRRRRGTALSLPRLIRDSCGWYALFSPTTGTPPASWPIPAQSIDQASDQSPNVGYLRVWRVPVVPMRGITPGQTSRARVFTFDPLGCNQPLFNLPTTPLEWTAAPPVTALPAALTVDMLRDDLRRVAMPASKSDSYLYGASRGLVVRFKNDEDAAWKTVPASDVRSCYIRDEEPVAPDFPVLIGGAIDIASLQREDLRFTLSFGDARATLNVRVPRKATLARVVEAVQLALSQARVDPGVTVHAVDVRSIAVGAIGSQLVLVPTSTIMQPLNIAPLDKDRPDPLLLAGTSAEGIAVATLVLQQAMIASLVNAAQGESLIFGTPQGQLLSVPLPLAGDATDAGSVAREFAKALPTCFICVAQGRVVVVPPPLSGEPVVPPWCIYAREIGLSALLTIDPQNGRLSLPTSWPMPFAISADYGYATLREQECRSELRKGLRAGVDLHDDGSPRWLDEQLALLTAVALQSTTMRLRGSASRSLTSQLIALMPAQRLCVESTRDSTAFFPATGDVVLSLQGPEEPGAAGQVDLCGLVLQARVVVAGGCIDLALHDVTLVAVADHPALSIKKIVPKDEPYIPPMAHLNAEMSNCITGPIDLRNSRGTLRIVDSAVSMLPVPASARLVLATSELTPVKLTRVTLRGRGVCEGALTAVDSIFAGSLECSTSVELSFSYVTDFQFRSSSVTHALPTRSVQTAPAEVVHCALCSKLRSVHLTGCMVQSLTLQAGRDDFCSCQIPQDVVSACGSCAGVACSHQCPLSSSGQILHAVPEPLIFADDDTYPHPDFMRLSDDNASTILRGSSNHDQPGFYSVAVPSLRQQEFDAALRSGLLFGARLSVTYET